MCWSFGSTRVHPELLLRAGGDVVLAADEELGRRDVADVLKRIDLLEDRGRRDRHDAGDGLARATRSDAVPPMLAPTRKICVDAELVAHVVVGGFEVGVDAVELLLAGRGLEAAEVERQHGEVAGLGELRGEGKPRRLIGRAHVGEDDAGVAVAEDAAVEHDRLFALIVRGRRRRAVPGVEVHVARDGFAVSTAAGEGSLADGGSSPQAAAINVPTTRTAVTAARTFTGATPPSPGRWCRCRAGTAPRLRRGAAGAPAAATGRPQMLMKPSAALWSNWSPRSYVASA